MLNDNSVQHEQVPNTPELMFDTTLQQDTAPSSMPKSVVLTIVYLVFRILFTIAQRIISSISFLQTYNSGFVVAFTIMIMLIGVLLPAILLILLLRKRSSFLVGIIILAVLDGIAMLQMIQSILSDTTSKYNITFSSIIVIVLYLASITIAIFTNSNKTFRSYCFNTPNHDRRKLLNTGSATAKKSLQNLVGIRGWLAVFAIFLCLTILVTITLCALFWAQLDSTDGAVQIASGIGPAIFLGFGFYIFPLISFIRLFQRRLDFRNSYITGMIIDMFLIFMIMLSPDGKIFWPFIPFFLIGILSMIVWTFYLYRSKRVLLSCTKVKPAKAARVDGQKWKNLY